MDSRDQYDNVFKLLLIGESGTGKSSIFMRFTEDHFQHDMSTTIGVDFKVRHLHLPRRNKRVKLTIWDTAGQERFRTLTSSYYRGAQGVVLVYDITRRSSFEQLEHWCKEVETYASYQDIVKVLVGNKLDLQQEQRQVTVAEGREFARRHGMLFLECSALTAENIDRVFEEVALKVCSLTCCNRFGVLCRIHWAHMWLSVFVLCEDFGHRFVAPT